MRILSLVLIAFFAALVGTPAVAADADVLRQFGVLGTLAVDCSGPASDSNPYLIFGVDAAGQATRTVRSGTSIDATLKIRNVQLVAADLLVYDETGRTSELRNTIKKIGGKYRGWQTVRTSGPENGTVLVKDGVSARTGKPMIDFTFCHAN